MKALLALTLTFGAAQANDTAIGGNGVTLLPIKNDNITMVDEHIVIDGVPTKDGLVSGWKVHCTFHFKNETDKPQKLTMGFPFQRKIEDLSGGEFPPEDPDPKKMSPADKAFYLAPFIKSFTTKVRGVAVKSKEIEIKDKRSPYGQAWVWDVEFAPGETIEVINTYEHESSSDPIRYWVDYILLTGKNWKGGKIGRSQLEVRPNIDFFLDDPLDYGVDEIKLEQSPKGVRMEQEGKFRKFVWDLKDFAPDEDLHCSFFPAQWALIYWKQMEKDDPFENYDCEDLRLMRNAYYAWYGYPFQSPDLKAHFSKMFWYKENPNFDIKNLSKVSQDLLMTSSKIIRAREQKKGCRK